MKPMIISHYLPNYFWEVTLEPFCIVVLLFGVLRFSILLILSLFSLQNPIFPFPSLTKSFNKTFWVQLIFKLLYFAQAFHWMVLPSINKINELHNTGNITCEVWMHFSNNLVSYYISLKFLSICEGSRMGDDKILNGFMGVLHAT
jgi:hypothetical protein